MRSTIHRSLHAFDIEMEAHAKDPKYKDKHGVVVSVLGINSITYFTANPLPNRKVIVTALEDRYVRLDCTVNEQTATLTLNWLTAATKANDVLLFLIDGIVPK